MRQKYLRAASAALRKSTPRQLSFINHYFGHLCCLWFVALFPVLIVPEVAQAQFFYSVTNGAITITRYLGTASVVVIPNNIVLSGVSLPVTGIGQYAFGGCTSLKNLGLPNNLTNIAERAFEGCSALTSVTIPDGVTSIAEATFSGCTSLASVAVGTNITSIGDSAFSSCPLTTFAFPNSVTNIGSAAFLSCARLTTVAVPDSVSSIGYEAFAGCTSLTAITVDTNNPTYSSLAGVLLDKTQSTLMEYPAGKTGGYTIPDSITNLEDSAFYYCTNLTSVAFPDSITSIPDNSFFNCTSLTNVALGNSLGSIGVSAFQSCSNLTSISIPSSVTNLGEGVFEGCTNLTSIAIPNGVTSIAGDSFFWCTSLARIVIPNSVTNIEYFALCNCLSLNKVTIPNSVTSIGDWAFCGCPLNSLKLGNSVTSIGEYAFVGCSTPDLTIPSSVTSIGDGAFGGCWRIDRIYFRGNAPTIGSDVFDGDNSTTVYYIPGTIGWAATFGGLPTAMSWLPNPQILNNGPSFGGQTNGFGFTISWATNQFILVEACTNLAHPSWSPAGTNTLIGGWSYFRDPAWTNYSTRFYRLHLLSVPFNYTISNGTITITNYTGLGGALIIPDTINGLPITCIGENAFAGCTNLTSVAIGTNVTSIGLGAFQQCSRLTAITVDTNNPAYCSVGGVLFDKSQSRLIQYPGDKVGAYTVPDGVTWIGEMAFLYCSSVTDITIPDGVTKIGSFAFEGCSSLNAYYFMGNAPSIGLSVFGADFATIYYLPGTTGWAATFGGLPTAFWLLPNPVILNNNPSFGVQSNGFGFIISWATNTPVAVDACTNLANPVWFPMATSILTDGTSDFSDPQWTNYPARFYRIRSP